MKLYDEQNQLIKGPITILGREGSVEALSFHHEVRIPTDQDTGALTGTRKHEPFIVSKLFDSTTPILNKACASGKTLSKVELTWYRINNQGTEEAYFTHNLTNAKVVSVKPMIDDVKNPNSERHGHREHISFRYQGISWTYLDGNIQTEDSWDNK